MMVRLKATAGRGSVAKDGSIQSVRPVVSQARAPRAVSSCLTESEAHRPVRQVREPGLVQGGQQTAGVGIAHVAFLAGHSVQARDHGLGDATRAVPAACEPDRIDAGIVGELDEGVGPRPVVTREMPMLQEAGGMEDDRDIALGMILRHPGLDLIRALSGETRAGADDADLETVADHAASRARSAASVERTREMRGRMLSIAKVCHSSEKVLLASSITTMP